MEAKAYKTKQPGAVEFNDSYNPDIPLPYLVTQKSGVAYARTEEFAQKIAAALNFFDTVMGAITNVTGSNVGAKSDNFKQYLIGGSWIAKIGYDYEKNKLRIWKMDDTFFTHLSVPVEVWAELLKSESVGGMYNRIIRGKYEIEK